MRDTCSSQLSDDFLIPWMPSLAVSDLAPSSAEFLSRCEDGSPGSLKGACCGSLSWLYGIVGSRNVFASLWPVLA